MLILIFASFIAGVLTVLSPCVFPFLPVVLSSSEKKLKKPIIVITSLCFSIVLSTLLFKGFVDLLGLPQDFLRNISSILLFAIGVFMIFPELWDFIEIKLRIGLVSNTLLNKSQKQEGFASDVLIGISLGPAFASCSPVYAIILSQILPVNFLEGTIYLVFYAIGLGFVLFLVALLGQFIIRKLKFALNPKGYFKMGVGFLLIIISFLIYFNYDKNLSSYLLENDYYLNTLEKIIFFESSFVKDL
jgi:cytochrome c biogenesis protein CcdA